ncbi:CBU_0592 family membrane protein [Curtobacterium sp. 'Ferrero']|uniref:CBU_0592 family membrane protein n=1 Tax=Curtobacterium sp. 'Ferrero' TaxID=2033654 RepID=UPI001596B0AE|nr:hypothetical protein [Curtobacterium sp. 'Ferrero']
MLVGIVEFLGWFGAVTVLAGYILFSTGKLQNGPTYQLLNLVGGLAIAVNVGAHHAIPSLIVNGIWSIVAVVVLTKMLRARRAAQRGTPIESAAASALVEPPTTTAILPVIGPALRDHEDEHEHQHEDAHEDEHEHQHDDAHEPDRAHEPDHAHEPEHAHGVVTGEASPVGAERPAEHAATGLLASTGADDAEPAPAPMTETVPIITATIALALVAAAQQEQQDQQAQHERARHDQRVQHDDRTQQAHHPH